MYGLEEMMLFETQRKGKNTLHCWWFMVQQLGLLPPFGRRVPVWLWRSLLSRWRGWFGGKMRLVQTWFFYALLTVIFPACIKSAKLILWQSYLFIDRKKYVVQPQQMDPLVDVLPYLRHWCSFNMRVTNNTCAVSRSPYLLVLNSPMNPLPFPLRCFTKKKSEKGDLAKQAPCPGTWLMERFAKFTNKIMG